MYKSYSMELAGRTLTVDIGRVAAQANGAVFIKYGDTTVLSTATASDKPRDGVDFFPLSVEFEEKLYAQGEEIDALSGLCGSGGGGQNHCVAVVHKCSAVRLSGYSTDFNGQLAACQVHTVTFEHMVSPFL